MQNDMRDRLIKTVKDSLMQNIGKSCKLAENIVDDLLANGAILPPCKVGDTFYGVNETSYDAYCVYGFKWGKRRGEDENVLIVLTTYDMEFVWGEEAFLTPEEAEKELLRKGNLE